MSQLVAIVKSLRNEEGQDLLEYALLVALIALIGHSAAPRKTERGAGAFSMDAPALQRKLPRR